MFRVAQYTKLLKVLGEADARLIRVQLIQTTPLDAAVVLIEERITAKQRRLPMIRTRFWFKPSDVVAAVPRLTAALVARQLLLEYDIRSALQMDLVSIREILQILHAARHNQHRVRLLRNETRLLRRRSQTILAPPQLQSGAVRIRKVSV